MSEDQGALVRSLDVQYCRFTSTLKLRDGPLPYPSRSSHLAPLDFYYLNLLTISYSLHMVWSSNRDSGSLQSSN